MNTNNKLGWIKKQFNEHNPDEIKDCDSVRVFVEFIDNKALWTLCHSRCETKESAMVSNLGQYTFLEKQYCQVINSLSDEIEKRGGTN